MAWIQYPDSEIHGGALGMSWMTISKAGLESAMMPSGCEWVIFGNGVLFSKDFFVSLIV